MSNLTSLQWIRTEYQPRLPSILNAYLSLVPKLHPQLQSRELEASLKALFPLTQSAPIITFEKKPVQDHPKLKIGVVLSGGQAPGGHTVIAALFDAAKQFHPDSELIGFKNGPSGIVKNAFIRLDNEKIAPFRNQGGFDLLGSGRTKIETPEQFEAAYQTVKSHDLDGLVIIGGDDSNTNAAFLAEYFAKKESKTIVCGVPKTIDGDLKNDFIELSFGFDTASKVYSEIIGNLLIDAKSSAKYYFFIKIMGRSASHLALECALQTHPNLTLISEEIAKKNQNLHEVIEEIALLICQRAEEGKNYGGILIPEGIIEFIPDFKMLVNELNLILKSATSGGEEFAALAEQLKLSYLKSKLTANSFDCLLQFPAEVQKQLLLDRDPHGNVQVSKIETERLFISLVEKRLSDWRKEGKYKGAFSPQPFFCGYEGRSALPTNFDCNYCYSLGILSALIIRWKLNGYMACINNLAESASEWEILTVPLCQMIHQENREGKWKAVIQKSLVNLNDPPFLSFDQEREEWRLKDHYCTPGPIQFSGNEQIADKPPLSLLYMNEMKQLQK